MVTKSKESPSASEMPGVELTLASVAPLWVEASERYQELCSLEDKVIAKIRELKPKIDRNGLALFREQNRLPGPAEAAKLIEVSPGAAHLLGDKFTPAPRAADPNDGIARLEPKIAREMRELSDQATALAEAKAALLPQLERAHREGSARLCDLLSPEYKSIASRICSALVELGLAHDEHRTFMERHRSAARSSLGLVHNTLGGDPRDPHSELRRLLSWAAEVGHFDPAALPAEWRTRQDQGAGRNGPRPMHM